MQSYDIIPIEWQFLCCFCYFSRALQAVCLTNTLFYGSLYNRFKI
ncbi:hypothetical protein HMPREF9296_2466 [Prevotella disiens FB035-09AN]|uniref:Uncharacterized protein n=1 Tax=Prevotella disiens FB035-09AN TaxID=866771 RepID=E1KNT1_9BACT|nr:hypothetical protein HMPREF9296_2466 [Prevotella disiens FB035-09AN]